MTSRGNRLMNGLLPVKGEKTKLRAKGQRRWDFTETNVRVRSGRNVSLLLADRCLTYPARHWVRPWQPQHFLWFSNKLRRDECLLSNQHENETTGSWKTGKGNETGGWGGVGFSSLPVIDLLFTLTWSKLLITRPMCAQQSLWAKSSSKHSAGSQHKLLMTMSGTRGLSDITLPQTWS